MRSDRSHIGLVSEMRGKRLSDIRSIGPDIGKPFRVKIIRPYAFFFSVFQISGLS
jgi:hypothetical protein